MCLELAIVLPFISNENNRSKFKSDNQWPTDPKNFNYTLGAGDKLTLTLLKEEKSLSQIVPNETNQTQNMILSPK